MRMIIVTVLAITGILACGITGMMAHVITRDFMDVMLNGTETNQDVLDTWDVVQVYGNNMALYATVAGIIGLVVWWFMSSQQSERVTGVYR